MLALASFQRISFGSGASGEINTSWRNPMESQVQSGIVNVQSNHSVDDTVRRLQSTLESKGIRVFALIDHSGEAAKAGMSMRPTKLLIFGNPKAGTPLMIAAPSIAIDLPLKLLVWEDAGGKVLISYNSVEFLQARHHFPDELKQNISVVSGLAAKAAE
jgi:uncharacterized protein (DUF302 family)